VSAPPPQAPLTPADTARLGLVHALRGAKDGARTRPLAESVKANLEHLWEHGGRDGDMRPGLRPEWITVRQKFLIAPTSDQNGPVLPKLIQSRGLQLKLELLLLFDAQCRHEPGRPVRNVRPVTARADDEYQSWRQLVLAETDSGPGSDRGPGELRARQITKALRALEGHDLLRIPRRPGGTRRIYGFGPDGKTTWQLQTEASSPDVHPDYVVPRTTRATFRIPREFFTNLWVFALTDTEIAAYLTLTFLRWRFPERHAEQGVYLLERHRRDNFRLTRATWRATAFLHRFRLIDRGPSPGRNFRTGNIGDFKRRWANRQVMPSLFSVNTQTLGEPALETMHQILTIPSDEDLMRREYGQQFVERSRSLTLDLGADFPLATPDVPTS
jgi:hypothetical protein